MSRFQANPELVLRGSELNRPRMTVEQEKMASQFPSFKFYGSFGKVTAVKGYLQTNFGNSYLIKIKIPDSYPYSMPGISLPYESIDGSCPHVYRNKEICVMKSEQWASSFSLAFMVAKAAIWLNKYDLWKRNGRGRWPGKEQKH
jgi:ubiquitin-protein ligase